MALTLPAGCWRQKNESETTDASGSIGFQWIAKGGYNSLKTLAGTLERGKTVVESGWVAQSWSLARCAANAGILTITCAPKDTEEDEDETVQTALSCTWSCKSVRNDVSILGYCQPGENADPSRVKMELWMKETDAEVADANQYHKNDTEIDSLGGMDQALAEKIRKGVESVMRFYPVLTCKAIYSTIPQTFLQNLSYVDTPSAPAAEVTHAPSNLAAVISAHEWVKCQDDVDEQSDGKFARIQSWMGILKSSASDGHPWDPDLYGPNRWQMPYA